MEATLSSIFDGPLLLWLLLLLLMLLMYSGEAGEEIGEDIEDDDDDDDEQVEADGDDDGIAEVASLDKSSRLARKIFQSFENATLALN